MRLALKAPGRYLRIASLTLLTGLPACTGGRADQWSGATIVIGIDGLRWDYPERFRMEALLDLADRGVRAKSLMPVFPTKTFPNFYALATGLFPNKSGIVSNTMYDPQLDARFGMGDTLAVRDGRWWGGEPVWVTAERQGKSAAIFFWPGSEAEIAGVRPSISMAYDGSVANRDRVEQALEWLKLPESKRPSLIMLYFSAVDDTAHRFGPESDETGKTVREVDALIHVLVSGLTNLGLSNAVNVVVVSDHGGTAQSGDRIIYLDDYVDPHSAGVLSYGEHVAVWPKPEAVDSVYLALADAHPELKVYRRDDLPARYHLGGHRRTPPIVAVPSLGWTTSTHRSVADHPRRTAGGGHGYDNTHPDMQAVFVAAGPSFRSGIRIDSLRAVDVYNLVARSIKVEPAPNDGDSSIPPQLLAER